MAEPGEVMRLPVSPARRVVAVGAHGMVGLLLLSAISLSTAETWWAPMILGALGALFLWQAWGMWTGSAQDLVLREDGLYDSSGACVAPLEQIAKVDRSVFAMKPSNGFLIVTHTPGGRAWVPGLWWRVGRRVGVGGMPSGRMARQMADVLSAMVAEQATRGDA